jgi:hypothetical protein
LDRLFVTAALIRPALRFSLETFPKTMPPLYALDLLLARTTFSLLRDLPQAQIQTHKFHLSYIAR